MLYGPSALLAFKLEMTFSTSIVVTGDTKKLLHCEVVTNSTKDLFSSCIALANVGPIEKKYLLNAFAILLASVMVSSPTINLLGKDSLPPLRLINCLIPLHVAFTLLTWYEKYSL